MVAGERIYQTTLKRKVNLRGIGLHTGSNVNCILHPAPANHGIVFLRSDLRNATQIKADITKVIRTDMSTTIGSAGAVVATVEHLMAALAGMGVDNALIEIDSHEVPIMDGSSREFALAIADAGIRELALPRKVIRLKKKVSLKNGDKSISAEPAKKLAIKGSIHFDHKAIGEQSFKFSLDQKCFLEEVAAARTFGFLKEVEYLHSKGLAQGGSLENVVVLDEAKVLNVEGLRYKNEFARHKVLDAIGDLALLGYSLQANIEIHKAGHELHTAFARKILSDRSNYDLVSLVEPAIAEEEEELAALAAVAY